MKRFVFALALAASVSGTAWANVYQHSYYPSEADRSYYDSRTAYYDHNQNRTYDRTYRGENVATDTYHRNAVDAQRMAVAEGCMNAGWMDNQNVQKWQAKNPGKKLCYSEHGVDGSPEYRKEL